MSDVKDARHNSEPLFISKDKLQTNPEDMAVVLLLSLGASRCWGHRDQDLCDFPITPPPHATNVFSLAQNQWLPCVDSFLQHLPRYLC